MSKNTKNQYFYELEKPELKKIGLKALEHVFGEKSVQLKILELLKKASFPKYLYWDKVKYFELPTEIGSPELFWKVVKISRNLESIRTPIKTEKGDYFSWVKILKLDEFLHRLDLNTGGHLSMFAEDLDEKKRLRFISNGIIEESIASSQLEGANTTRKMAKQFLLEGRKPKNNSEQMILNNYEAMLYIEEDLKKMSLDTSSLFNLHAILTKNTLSTKDIARFRRDVDEIVVSDNDGMVYHIPPRESFLLREMENFLDFCNDKNDEENFLHPVIKAIMIHFWVGYLHPFVDGNGRMARALFYWYLLKKGYWAFAYLPISMTIRKSPQQYKMAYLYSEQDDNDLTYFIDYNINKIKLSLKDFEEYIVKKEKEAKIFRESAIKKFQLNERQLKLLQYFQKNPEGKTFARMHANIYQISWLTAANDLKEMEKDGLLESEKMGKNKFYRPTTKIDEFFE